MKAERQGWEKNRKVSLAPDKSARAQFIGNAFLGKMSLEDQAYMCRAILAISDENAELKQRLKALELAVGQLAQGQRGAS